MVSDLRRRTGAGIMECKEVLCEASGDAEKAIELLRKRGIAKSERKGGRETKEGLVTSYLHGGGRIGVLVEVDCETDFVSRTEDFSQLTRNLAMQIAASHPRYLKREEVPQEVLNKEKEIISFQAKQAGKSEAVISKMMEGKLEKFYEENCLLDQVYIRDQDKKVKELIIEAIAKFGENITVRRFARFGIGESTAFGELSES
ncbi:MAG: elongation factor Ts [Deltaproteobacteria bacterium]|nr:elongation factor Ts [Deltaproteobacteria bacterium]